MPEEHRSRSKRATAIIDLLLSEETAFARELRQRRWCRQRAGREGLAVAVTVTARQSMEGHREGR